MIIAKNDQRTSPYPHCISGSGAGGTSDPPNRQRPPPHFMRECIPPNLHDPPRAKGSLNRRFEWFSLVTFFLQKKKVTRAGARNAPACARRRNTCTFPRKEVLKRSFKRLSSPRFFRCWKKCGRRRLAPAGAKLSPSETNHALAAGARNSPSRHTKKQPSGHRRRAVFHR